MTNIRTGQTIRKRISQIWYLSQEEIKVCARLTCFTIVSNYSSALKELIRCESKSKFRKFARKAAKKAGTPLASFLVLPVLRVGEYVRDYFLHYRFLISYASLSKAYLLNSLVALTDEDHPDFDDCKDALDHISEVSEYINEERRKAENMNNTFQIQFSFVDKLVPVYFPSPKTFSYAKPIPPPPPYNPF